MHYPKSRTTGAAFCLEEDVILIRDEGGGGMPLRASFFRRRQVYNYLFTLHYYLLLHIGGRD